MRLEHMELISALATLEPEARQKAERLLSEATQATIDETGRGLDLSEADLSNLDLRGVDLRRAVLNRALLHGAQLQDANLSEITMVCPGLERTNFAGANLKDAYVHALAAQTCNFDGVDMSGLRDATGTLFHGCRMRGANLSAAHLAGAAFYQCDLTDAQVDGSNLQGTSINECLLDNASFSGALVDQLTVTKSSMNGTDLSAAIGADVALQRLTGADGVVLESASLPNLRVSGVRGAGWNAAGMSAERSSFLDVCLDSSTFERANLSSSTFSNCVMPSVMMNNACLSNAAITGSTFRRAQMRSLRAENLHIVESDLSESNLESAMARCLVARDVNLTKANMANANLYRAMLTGDPPSAMSLRGACLEGSTMIQAYVAADLSGANVSHVNAAYSRFSQSNITGASFAGAALYESTWVKVESTDAQMEGASGPMFVDRCNGLAVALSRTHSESSRALQRSIADIADVLAKGKKGST